MESLEYILAVDQGSSGTMVALFDREGRMVDAADTEVAVMTPGYGLVEQDPAALVDSIRQGARELMQRHPDKLEGLRGVAVANQGESFLLWDKATDKPLTPVISWQDARGEELCRTLQAEGRDGWFHQKTGLHLSSEWPALKIRQLRETDPELDRRCRAGEVLYGQLDAWFLYVLSHGSHHASDHSTACRSGLYNIGGLEWDSELIGFFAAEGLQLPRLVDNTHRFEGVDLGIGKLLPWLAGGLDQSVAMIGQGCVRSRTAKVTYGTCVACWMNMGEELVLDPALTSSVAWKAGDTPVYALAAEGGNCGNIMTWLKRNFHTGWKIPQLADIAESSGGQPNLLFVPAFNGLTAPYWKTEAKGTLFGMTAGTGPAHILRAGYDSIAYTVRDILDIMPKCDILVVDGGMTDNSYLMRKQANVLGRAVIRTGLQEGTIAGIAHLARLGLGWISSLEEIPPDPVSEEFVPELGKSGEGYDRWKRAVAAVIRYYDENDME